MEYVLRTNNLTKTIKGRNLVSNLSINVPKGRIYGFLGPNGAGKTTTMKMITNLWKPTSGDIELFGKKLEPGSYEVLKRMGSIIEYPPFFDHLTARENLKLHAEYMGYYSPKCVENALEMLKLSDKADVKVREFSLGMKERLGIARAILSKPELLILDEPTNGLDPAGIKQIRDLLKMLCGEFGITIFISSHLLSEIQNIADVIGVINNGKLISEVSMSEISEAGLEYIEITTRNSGTACYVLLEKLGIKKFKSIDDNTIRIYDNRVSPKEISLAMINNNVDIDGIVKKSESLEDYFLKLTEGVK